MIQIEVIDEISQVPFYYNARSSRPELHPVFPRRSPWRCYSEDANTLGDMDRDKYMAIGESDRMTLKFVKPL